MISEFLGLKLPIFMPDATLGSVRSLTTQQIKETGINMLVVNTYHLMVTLGVDGMKKVGGIKNFMNWKGKVLSDSGGFQVFSLIHKKSKMGKVTPNGAIFKSPIDGRKFCLTPELSVEMQIAIGSDVIVMLDDCRDSSVSQKHAEVSVKNTINWAKRGKNYLLKEYPNTKVKMFAVVQGGMYKDLRKRCAEELIKIGFDGYCFGGWPINDKGRLDSDILGYTAQLIPEGKPKYAMGIGTPEDIVSCYKIGYNMFDCVIPTRNARHGLLYTSDGKKKIKSARFKFDDEPIDKKCNCYTCKNFTKSYLHHLFKSNEITGYSLATIHNLRYFSNLTKRLSEQH